MRVRTQVGESLGGSKDASVETAIRDIEINPQGRCVNPEKNLVADLTAAGAALDKAEKHAAEWGYAWIASAVLVDTQRIATDFSIGADTSYDEFAKAAREGRQGAAARYIEDTFKARLELEYGQSTMQEREDRITEAEQQRRFYQKQHEAELERRRLEQLRDTPLDETPAPSEPDPDPVPGVASADLLPELPTTAVFVGSNFHSGQGLLQTPVPPADGKAPDLTELALLADELRPSEGDVMKVAASNKVTQRILNYLTKPVEPGYDHVPWFMVTEVSVSPGGRTSRDYVAETTLHPYYATLDGRKVTPEEGEDFVHPGIFAAFPLLEAQALDLRNSERYETQISLALAAKLLAEGKQTEAKFFLEKMTKVQQDIATRTLLPVVVPSSNGKEVTYRFDPGLQGLVEPGNRKKGSGMILNANCVPALIVIMTDRDSLKKMSHLHFELHTRWMPKKKANLWSSTWDGVVRNYNPRTGMLPSDVISAAVSLDQGRKHLNWAEEWAGQEAGLRDRYRDSFKQVKLRRSALESKLGSTTSSIALPVHYNIIPGAEGLKLDSRYEQKIMVERVSGTNTDSNHPSFRSLSKVHIGGFPFVEKTVFGEMQTDAAQLGFRAGQIMDRLLKKQAETKSAESLAQEWNEYRTFEQQAQRKEAEIRAMGFFEVVDSRNVVITLPADRAWTLPTGVHPVAGEWGGLGLGSAVTFGTIKLTDLDGIHVAPTAAVTIPPKLPAEGLSITVTGLNLERVRSAYWNSDLKPIAIVSQGKEKLVLRVTARPPAGTKEILISDTLPPDSAITASIVSRNIVGSVPVTVQEEPKASLKVTTSKVANGEEGKLRVTFDGEFPEGEIVITAVTEFLTRSVPVVERKPGTITVEVVRGFISNVVAHETSSKFTLVHSPSKASVTVSVPLLDATHQIAAVLPSDLNAAVINGDSDTSLKIFGSFPSGPLEVYIGGILVHDLPGKEIASPIEIPLRAKEGDKYHKNLTSLKRRVGKQKLMLVSAGNLYEWKGEIVISGD